ncbi:MAG TPA: ion transporter [Candidatus Binatia bacterium]|nr:ion transporter [Candidatus Binatia bacterium]
MHDDQYPVGARRRRLHEIIFEADTAAGRRFDSLLLLAIILSIVVVLLDSVASIRERYHGVLLALEWTFTILFTIEYGLRLYAVREQWRYATSFFGIVDVLAVLPNYLSLVVPGAQSLVVIRALRMLRVFRIFKLAEYLEESRQLWDAMRASRRKISIFLFVVLTIVVIVGSAMYLIEGPEHGFDNIPVSIYWAVVTLTTVGYGDISPQTPLGQLLATVVMLLGYGIIAVPTGIVTAEMTRTARTPISGQACPSCAAEGHEYDARFCRKCGSRL